MSHDTSSSTKPATSTARAVQGVLRAPNGQVPVQATLIATGIALAGLLIVAGSLLAAGAVAGGVAVGMLLAVSIATVAIDRPIRALVGGLLLLGSVAGALAVPIGVGTQLAPATGAIAGAGVLVGFGLARFRLAAFGAGAVGSALGWLARVTLIVLATAVVVGLVTLDLPRVLGAVGTVVPVAPLVTPTAAGSAMVGFVAVSWLAYGGIWLATVAAPVSSLLSPTRQARVDAMLERVLTGVGAVFGVGSILVAVVYALLVTGGLLPSVAPLVAAVVESTPLRVILLRVGLTGAVVAVTVTLIKSVGATAVGARPTWLPPALIVTAGVTAVSVGVGERLVATLVTVDPTGGVSLLASLTGPTTVGLVGVVGGFVGIGVLLALAPLADALGVIPAQTAGARLVLLGLIVAAVSVALGDGAVVRPLVGVVAGIAAWDIAAYGAEMTADVGATPAHRDGAVIHAGSTLLVGGLVLLGASVAYFVLTAVSGVVAGTIVTAILAVAAVVVLVGLLR